MVVCCPRCGGDAEAHGKSSTGVVYVCRSCTDTVFVLGSTLELPLHFYFLDGELTFSRPGDISGLFEPVEPRNLGDSGPDSGDSSPE